MEILRIELGAYRSIAVIQSIDGSGLDPSRISVLFGANGAGKSNVLECIAWIFSNAATGEAPPNTRLGGSSEIPEDRFPGRAVIRLNHWREEGSIEQQLLWKILTNPDTRDSAFWWPDEREIWADATPDTTIELEEVFEQFPASCSGTNELERVIHLWADVLAAADSTASYDDRYALARALIEQGVFSTDFVDVLLFVAGDLAEDTRAAALRVAQSGSEWRRDPLLEAANHVAGKTSARRPPDSLPPESWRESTFLSIDSHQWLFGPEFSGEFLTPTQIPELDELFANVWRVDAGADRLALELNQAVTDAPIPPQQLTVEANRVAPGFVRERGSIEIGDAGEVRFLENNGHEAWLVGDVGDGMKRWIAISVLTAIHRITSPEGFGLCLIDEPEAHLHLRAIRSVAEWLVERNHEGIGCIVSTHALELFNLPTNVGAFGIVTREEDRPSQLNWVTHSLVESLRSHAAELGISPADALRTARGVLILEGRHDEQVIRHYFGRELAAQRTIILRLYGINEALALVELDYLSMLDIPMVMLWDAGPKEDKILATLQRHGSAIRQVTHGAVDIACMLPDESVRAAVRPDFPGWEALAQDWQQTRPRPNFKAYVASRLGITINGAFIANVLAKSSHPSAGLTRAMQEAFTELDRASEPNQARLRAVLEAPDATQP